MSGSQDILARLEGVRRTGDGRWIARCLAHEVAVLAIVSRDLIEGRPLSAKDHQRLVQAAGRINAAKGVCGVA